MTSEWNLLQVATRSVAYLDRADVWCGVVWWECECVCLCVCARARVRARRLSRTCQGDYPDCERASKVSADF